MRSPSKRSRSKSNRPKPLGNIVNRVFESSGPEGKVRGTPQQIIEKYLTLARDAQLSGDRVASENFLQHGEHYARMLNDAQREMAREAEARREQSQNNQQSGQHGGRRGEAQQDSQNGGHGSGSGSGGGHGRQAQSGSPTDESATQADRASEAQTDGQREAQRDGTGEPVGERRAAGRNRRRDQKQGDQNQGDHGAANGADIPHSRNTARNRNEAAGLDTGTGLGDDGDAALVDTPEGRAARQTGQGNEAESAMIAETATGDTGTAEAGPRFVTEAQPGADDSVAAAEPASTGETGKPRRKPAARKPRADTAARRSPRSSAKDGDDAARNEGSSNAAE